MNLKQKTSPKVKWDVWLAYVHFSDGTGGKVRPVVIYDDHVFTVDCLTVTSRSASIAQYQLQEWSAAGLSKPSAVAFSELTKLSETDFVYYVGRLHIADIRKLSRFITHT